MMDGVKCPKTILVVDDEPAVRKVLRAILESHNYQVIEAANGKFAIKAFQNGSVDLMITDIFMPEREGMETISIVRNKYPEVKIIAMSGEDGQLYLKVAQVLGAEAILQKPLRSEDVLRAVRSVFTKTHQPH